jgi:hypothetical protein
MVGDGSRAGFVGRSLEALLVLAGVLLRILLPAGGRPRCRDDEWLASVLLLAAATILGFGRVMALCAPVGQAELYSELRHRR